jgi:hypothetical protein
MFFTAISFLIFFLGVLALIAAVDVNTTNEAQQSRGIINGFNTNPTVPTVYVTVTLAKNLTDTFLNSTVNASILPDSLQGP